jgi:hypothetical protein
MLEEVREIVVKAMLGFIVLYAVLVFSPYVLLKVIMEIYQFVVPSGGLLWGGAAGEMGGR